MEVPDQERKHLHQTKYVIIHEYDDKDEEPNYYHHSSPKTYSELKYYGGDGGDLDANKYGYDHDDHDYHHSAYLSSLGDGDKDGQGHSYGHSYSTGYKTSSKDGEKKASPGPNAYTTKDKDDGKNKVEFNFYHDYSLPNAFDEYGPKNSYEIEALKTTGTPFNSVSAVIPTKASFKSFSPTPTTLKSFSPTKFPTYVQTTGYYAKNYQSQPSAVPYTHDSNPLSEDFKDYEKSKSKTEDYIYSNSPSYEHKSYDDVKKGVEAFNNELSRIMDKKIEEDDYTLQRFRHEDALDEIDHAKFVSDIEYDHSKF